MELPKVLQNIVNDYSDQLKYSEKFDNMMCEMMSFKLYYGKVPYIKPSFITYLRKGNFKNSLTTQFMVSNYIMDYNQYVFDAIDAHF